MGSRSWGFIRKHFWFLFAALLLLIRGIGNLYPSLIEYGYARGFFLGIRAVLDYTIGLLPLPMFYLFFLVVGVLGMRYLVRSFRIRLAFRERLKNFGFLLLKTITVIVAWFLLIWGMNYGRIPIEEQLGLSLEVPTLDNIKAETQWATKKALDLRLLVASEDTNALDETLSPNELEQEMRRSLKSVLKELGYPSFGNVRARQLYPKGLLMRLRTAGIYWFFVGEGNIDAGLHPLQKPFTMAHEMAHGYGFGDEGTCNFLAYLACLKSGQAYIRYAGMLAYWRYIASEYVRRAPEEYTEFRAEHVASGMRNDLNAIYENGAKYRDVLPLSVRNSTYNTYLKLQGIDDGIENYSRIVLLVNAWKRR